MSVPIVLSPETAMVTKANYKAPLTAAQAEAAEAAAASRIEDSLPNEIEVTIPEGSIDLAT